MVIIRHVAAVIAISVSIAACASAPRDLRSYPSAGDYSGTSSTRTQAPVQAATLIASSSDHQKVGNPYTVAGRRYVPRREDNYDRVGIASWYGPNFHGRPTANGEVFDQDEMTAAHTTLPIPSIAEVTNLENGRSIIVRINDRGPFVDDRIIDLSRASATELGFIRRGLARVRVRYLGPAHAGASAPPATFQVAERGAPAASTAPVEATFTPIEPASAARQLTLQVGAFSTRANAERFAARISSPNESWIAAGESNGRAIFRVFVGRWNDRPSAARALAELADAGIYDARIVTLD